MNTGQAIRTLRVKHGLTQAQLGELCGMSTNAICSLETEKSHPPKATLDRICQALGVPPSYILLAAIDEGDFPEEKRVLYRTMLEPLRQELLSGSADAEVRILSQTHENPTGDGK